VLQGLPLLVNLADGSGLPLPGLQKHLQQRTDF